MASSTLPRKRNSNFSDAEVNYLVEIMNDGNVEVIESKATDNATLTKKQKNGMKSIQILMQMGTTATHLN